MSRPNSDGSYSVLKTLATLAMFERHYEASVLNLGKVRVDTDLLGDPVSHIGRCREASTMRATEEMPLDLDPVSDHFALAMLANRSHRLDRALETIECMSSSSSFDYKSLVVFVATDFAICHRTPPRLSATCSSRQLPQ